MRSSTRTKKVRAENVPTVVAEEDPGADSAKRTEHIAMAAYYKAEARGFVPGMEMDDWLEAELEYDGAVDNT